MIRRIRSVYIDEAGKKTEETLVLEIAVNNKGQPDFKQASEVYGHCKILNEDTGKLELFPWIGVYTNSYILADFGDTFAEYAKEIMETPSKPKFGRYFHILTKDLDVKVGKNLIMAYSGEKFPYQITRCEDFPGK